MRHIKFKDHGPWPIALLIKSSAFVQHEIQSTYLAYLEKRGIQKEEVIAFSLAYNDTGKAPVSFIKDYLETLMIALSDCDVEHIYCADANYFKVLTGARKADPHLGYILPCKIEGFEHMKVILGINHRSLIYNPANEPKLLMSMDTLVDAVQNTHVELGSDIIKEAHYPDTPEQIKNWLKKLHEYPHLACDIEAFSLDFDKAGIGTITFCWDEHHGIAFACDYAENIGGEKDDNGFFGEYLPNPYIRMLLREFFETYQGHLTFHRANYDVKVLIAQLWMEDWLDTAGLLTGLDILCERMHDTRIIAYLALNSTAGNKLSLKDLAHEFAGNWAQDEIKDIRKIPLPDLLQYNLVDGLSTHYVFKKLYPKLVADQQEELYYSLMMPSQKVIIQMELTGMPLDPQKVQEARVLLEAIIAEQRGVFQSSQLVKKAEDLLTHRAWEKDYEGRKNKAKNPDKIMPKDRDTFPQVIYNPGSNQQTQVLLYELGGFPVIDKTDTGQPAVGGDTLKKLANHTQDPQMLQLLEALQDYDAATKILGTFITAFEKAMEKGSPVVWIHGSFNLGGTVSGRLSSSEPNMQNLPSGSRFGKLVKECFVSFPGWIFCGADFSALEDRINALLTKDPAKLKIYTDGYDGHCLRTHAYWPNELKDVRQADGAERCFKVVSGGKTIFCKSGDLIVTSSGQKIPVEEYYAAKAS